MKGITRKHTLAKIGRELQRNAERRIARRKAQDALAEMAQSTWPRPKRKRAAQ